MSLLNYFMTNGDKNGISYVLSTALLSPAHLFSVNIADISFLKKFRNDHMLNLGLRQVFKQSLYWLS